MPTASSRTPILVALCAPIWGAGDQPTSHPPIDGWREWRRVRDLVQGLHDPKTGRGPPWRLVRLQPPTLARLREALRLAGSGNPYGLVHLAGAVGEDGLLRMELPNGREHLVTPGELADAFADHPVPLVLLTICRGRPYAEELVHRAGVGAVVTSCEELSEPEAALLARQVYLGLASGLAIGAAFDRAQSEIRRGYKEGTLPPIDDDLLGLSRDDYAQVRAEKLFLCGLRDTVLPAPADATSGPDVDLAEPPHNLPHFHEVPVARGWELSLIGDWMDEQLHRLIAITGVGGSGKSSLALRAALRACWRYRAIVHFNAKASAAPATPGFEGFCRLLETVMELGNRLSSAGDLLARFDETLDVLNSRPCLLVLDNVELLPAADLEIFNRLLRRLDPRNGSMVLVTARPEHLPPLFDRTKGGFYHLPHHRLGEWDAVTLVGGLLRLPAERDPTGRELAAWSKVPVRVPSSQEAEIVERVGRVCDVPVEHVLALKELAGAAHGHLFLLRFAAAQLHEPEATWDQVMARLRHLGGQDLEARLDAMIGQMFEDLERRGFAATRVAQALTVFQGGAATDALQFVCCGRHLPSTSAEAIVHGDYGSALKRASLLEFEPATQRLGLHPLVRHYVLTRRMPAERDLAGWKQAHALWFAQLAHRQRGDFAALEQERLNLLAGAATVQELGDDRRLVDLAEDLFPWLWVRGHWLDARRLLSAALAAARRLDRISSEALLLHGLGLVCRSLGDYDDAQRNYEACIALEQAAHHRKALAQTLHEFALLCLARGDHAGARSACRRALPLQEEIDDHVGQAYTRSTLALLDLLAYELASAEAHHRRALQLAKEAGHPYLQALSWLGLAISALARNQPDEALVGWDSGRVLEHVPSGLIMKAATLHTLAVLAGECGETAEACRLFREALQWEAKAGDRAAQSETLRELALACQRLDQLDAAHAAMEDSLAHARDLGDRLGRTRALWSHGTLEREESATAVANELHRAGLAIAEEIGNSYWQGQHLDGLAQCAQALGQQAEAQRLAVQAQAKLGGPPRRYICFWDRNKLESERLSLGQPVSFPFGED